MSRLGSVYIRRGEPEGELPGCCEVSEWAANEIEKLDEEVASLRNALSRYSERAAMSFIHDQIMALKPYPAFHASSYDYGFETAKHAAGLIGAKADLEIARLTIALDAAQGALKDAIQDCRSHSDQATLLKEERDRAVQTLADWVSAVRDKESFMQVFVLR